LVDPVGNAFGLTLHAHGEAVWKKLGAILLVHKELSKITTECRDDGDDPGDDGSPVKFVPEPVDAVALVEIWDLPLTATDNPVVSFDNGYCGGSENYATLGLILDRN
jgi:hypothetical protein